MSIKVSVCVTADAQTHVRRLGTRPKCSTHVLHVHPDRHGPPRACLAALMKPFWRRMHAGKSTNVPLVLLGKCNLTLGRASVPDKKETLFNG